MHLLVFWIHSMRARGNDGSSLDHHHRYTRALEFLIEDITRCRFWYLLVPLLFWSNGLGCPSGAQNDYWVPLTIC
ncbi:uncharacterized protein ARMOST_10991 [Armillaria ostoyae]|uniref:Uncharacterized protein n=1 Tax=Armillaria ostoyae TaxID=47428 RepID=A0A284RFV6_ARMOS|nr:uncharacterized protein ARMOST_10991 [Armillaria ostoyae]